MVKHTQIAILIFLLTTCSFTDEKAEEIHREQRQSEIQKAEKQERKQRILKEWAKEYEINALWDTLDYPYSIQYENLIVNGYQIIEDAEILDIYSKGEEKYASIKTRGFSASYFDLKLTEGHVKKVLSENSDSFLGIMDECMMVIKIDRIRQFGVKLETDYDEDYGWSYLVDADEFFVIGKVVEIEIIK
ncbi:hypothetical protein O3Q51_17045 [Cryomorphaceae bacterium 1068]|nr:hypothetical protein [Cryomorphaceae bacterium 1068]